MRFIPMMAKLFFLAAITPGFCIAWSGNDVQMMVKTELLFYKRTYWKYNYVICHGSWDHVMLGW